MNIYDLKKAIDKAYNESLVMGKDLDFLYRIKSDGSGVECVNPDYIEACANEKFTINRLSITEETYIASGFNSFVVKLK